MNLICHPTGTKTNSPLSMNKVLKVISRVSFSSNPNKIAPFILSVLQKAVVISINSLECRCQTHLREEFLIAWKVKTFNLSFSSGKQLDLHLSKSKHQMLIITCLETRKSISKGICQRTSWLAIDFWPSLDFPISNPASKAHSCQFQRHIWRCWIRYNSRLM